MANKLYSETAIQNIANAIRGKNGSSDTYTVSEMSTAISNIPTGGGGMQIKQMTYTGTGEGRSHAITFPEDVKFIFAITGDSNRELLNIDCSNRNTFNSTYGGYSMHFTYRVENSITGTGAEGTATNLIMVYKPELCQLVIGFGYNNNQETIFDVSGVIYHVTYLA